ncbi:hypothetical protein ASE61_14955 [Bosea sp. Root670]|uniref:hypothetical protein n=1 Tax=Bosea sp. Root670 TaxID=1736583 RepID=UPI0007145D93|nr:hypothetical protein [Bosea sp. Root670]KRE02576.1 hypothetical protein ASE61_14955 [Bosea sp. Root670]
MANQIEQLLTVVDAFCAARGISEARASTLIFNGGGRIKQLRDGRDIGVLTSLSALLWLSANWPEDTEWPCDIPRPSPASAPPELASVCNP